MSWQLLEIDLSSLGRPVQSEEFRSALASLGDSVDPMLFHYQSDGKTNTSPFPPFRIYSTGRMGTIAAVGFPAAQYLVENGHRLTAGVSRRFGIKRTAEYRSGGVFQVTDKPYGLWYLIPTLVFQRSCSDYQRFRKNALKNHLSQDITTAIKTIIRRDILMHSDYLGLDIDPDFTLEALSVEKFCPIKVKKKRYNLAACGVRFKLDLVLQGVFNLGYLKSRGKGRMILMRNQSQQSKKKAEGTSKEVKNES